ncbi:MAG: APC family permease [Oscillospiraceae bacterium]|nr:APC family permease [Oscillospiraceae bacterium]
MKTKKEHYGFFTALSMIIGIVIGSGIFFKSPLILTKTGGSVGYGVAAFCILALSIVFGCLTLSELSVRTAKSGGAVGYFEDFISPRIAAGFGWFQTLVYLPALTAVVAWVAGVYTCLVFAGQPRSLGMQVFIGTGWVVLLFAVNIISVKLGGYLQNATMVIKLIPLLLIAAGGLIWGASHGGPPPAPAVVQPVAGLGWMAALPAIAFSFDGWIVSVVITNEVKVARKNIPLALTIAPLVILAVYILYFVGMSAMLGPQNIVAMGNASVSEAVSGILGAANGRGIGAAVNVLVLCAVLGVVNGLILGMLRMPQALASKNMLPRSGLISRVHPSINLSPLSCAICFVLTAAWMLIHYWTQSAGILAANDVSEIAIVFSYVCFAVLYVRVIVLWRRGEIKSLFKGLVSPVLATVGSAVILAGGVAANPVYTPVFFVICLSVCAMGYLYFRRVSFRR